MRFYSENLGLSESAFSILRDLIHEKTGIFFSNDKKDILSDKLSARVIELGFNSFVDYFYLLKYDEQALEEWEILINLITVNETYFWREIDQINALVKNIIPNYLKENPGKPIKIWCAACSTGEEPFSIAIALSEAGLLLNNTIEIFASDASSNAIEKAKLAAYRERSFRTLPDYLKQKYFSKNGENWELDSKIKNLVTFSIVNLMNEEEVNYFASVPFIFCRNVLIYFNDFSIRKLADTLYKRMPREAYLFIGVSESLLRVQSKFTISEAGNAYVYLKKEE
ncbi:MAG: protein-glutamate O-methyltransferase CheR [Bacteroidota bacterium]